MWCVNSGKRDQGDDNGITEIEFDSDAKVILCVIERESLGMNERKSAEFALVSMDLGVKLCSLSRLV